MRRFFYWLCFSLVALSSALDQLAWLPYLIGAGSTSLGSLFSFRVFMSFASLVPPMFKALVPGWVAVTLSLLMFLLVVRRLWLRIGRREAVPHSFAGVPKVLAYVGAWSFILALVVLLLSIALRAGSGVPAGMLLIPALFCVPWAFFITEVLSFRQAKSPEAIPAGHPAG